MAESKKVALNAEELEDITGGSYEWVDEANLIIQNRKYPGKRYRIKPEAFAAVRAKLLVGGAKGGHSLLADDSFMSDLLASGSVTVELEDI